ncbi:MAG: phage major capsid protein [bacterium]|jgi:HK97 family phage major capsid protein
MKWTDEQLKELKALGFTDDELKELEDSGVTFDQAKALGEKVQAEARQLAEESARTRKMRDTAAKVVDRKRREIEADEQKAAEVTKALTDSKAMRGTFEVMKVDAVANEVEKMRELGIDYEKAGLLRPLKPNVPLEIRRNLGPYTEEEKAGLILAGRLFKAIKEKRYAEVERINDVINADRDERQKALTSTVSGSPYLTPVGYEAAVIRLRDEFSPYFALVNRIPVQTPTGKMPYESALGTAYWAAEANAITAGDPTLAQLAWSISTLGAITIWSDYLDSAGLIDIGQYIAENHGRRFALSLWDKLITGTGTNQPKGLNAETITQTAAQAGTNLAATDIINFVYALPAPYRANSVILANDASLKLVRNLRATGGEFLWGSGLVLGQPPTIDGHPVYSNSYIAANTAGARKMYIFDPSFYRHFEMEGITVELATEYAASTDLFATGQVALKTTMLCDAKLAFVGAAATLTGVK